LNRGRRREEHLRSPRSHRRLGGGKRRHVPGLASPPWLDAAQHEDAEGTRRAQAPAEDREGIEAEESLMNARIHKKRWARAVCAGYTAPLAITHAKPSFYALAPRYRRLVLADRLHRTFDTAKDIAMYVARRMWT
jgi:hypothetical protein